MQPSSQIEKKPKRFGYRKKNATSPVRSLSQPKTTSRTGHKSRAGTTHDTTDPSKVKFFLLDSHPTAFLKKSFGRSRRNPAPPPLCLLVQTGKTKRTGTLRNKSPSPLRSLRPPNVAVETRSINAVVQISFVWLRLEQLPRRIRCISTEEEPKSSVTTVQKKKKKSR